MYAYVNLNFILYLSGLSDEVDSVYEDNETMDIESEEIENRCNQDSKYRSMISRTIPQPFARNVLKLTKSVSSKNLKPQIGRIIPLLEGMFLVS